MKTVLSFMLILVLLWLAALPPTIVQAQIPATATPTDGELLSQAKQLADDSASGVANAQDIIRNADNAIKTTSFLVRAVIVASIIGGALVLAIGYLTVRAVLGTIRENQKELAKARLELADMRNAVASRNEQMHSQTQNAIQALGLMQLGEQQLEQGNVQGAIKMYQLAYKADPSNHATNYFLGELHIQNEELDAGIKHLKLVLDGEYDYAPSEAAMGRALWKRADQANNTYQQDILFAQAEERFLKALRIDPTVLDIRGESIHVALGQLYKRRHRLDKAVYHMEEARKISPQALRTLAELALLYYGQSAFERARPYFELIEPILQKNVNFKHTDDQQTRIYLITTELALGKPTAALQELKAFLEEAKSDEVIKNALQDFTLLKQSSNPPEGIDQVTSQVQAALQKSPP